MSSSATHWADALAAQIVAGARTPAVISSGISPSGEIHIGNMREVLTADAVFRALKQRDYPARFNFVADNFDPLRRVYPFLDAAVYAPLVGRPLSEIPCPCGDHVSYAEHFLQPFLAALRGLAVTVELERADQLYKSGRMTPYIVRALESREPIAAILRELTGRETDAAWSPFNPLCPACGRITHAAVTGFSAADESVDYACECGSRGTLPMAGGGKLVWRIDWPARWMLLGVTVEPFGKDHATAGGSYDTGVRIAREVFGGEPPFPVPYEWIRLKGQGDMSSSKGNVLSIARVLEVVPPEVLRYLVLRERPQKTIDFDPGLPLLQLVDEVDDATAAGRDERALELSRAGEFRPTGVPFKHLVVVAQAAGFAPAAVGEILARTGYPDATAAAVTARLEYVRRWLEGFAPEDLRFTVQSALPAAAAALLPAQREFLGRLAERLAPGMDGQAVHQVIYELAPQFPATKPAVLFQAIYIALIGKPHGPRAGWFIALLGPEFCRERFREASVG
ncbi:MAG TPA: lysine--tRNA ligase [Candidatus Polarisedimenticolaceae bacterium]|nr:lysine--tRNA ligase [Candidatus Polarisedimenticolaceae bacterium]